MEHLGFDVGYGWWKPAASKMQPLQDMQIRDDPKKDLHDVRIFVGLLLSNANTEKKILFYSAKGGISLFFLQNTPSLQYDTRGSMLI